ncbi:MAG: asparagine synthase (glutamine-hydrolyzing) [Synechococcaceae cyanobacterium ELA739]
MCGIAGWLIPAGPDPGLTVLEAMAVSLRHRGPDDSGFHFDSHAGVALAHRRLSIIDLSPASHQPMVDSSSGVVLSFNGEIYNFRQLRDQLIALGHRFQSTGDTEVLLRSYLQWGLSCLPRLAGMFAFAIWDPRSSVLHLARDAMGMKPLYVLPYRGGHAFASEIKALLRLPGYQPKLDPMALQQYLEFGYVLEPTLTILDGIGRLAPGESVSLHQGRISNRQRWYIPPNPQVGTATPLHQRTDELLNCLDQVVAEHLEADVPVGLLLSGGLDSSLLAALASRHGPLTTVTMGFENSSMDERPQAQLVADHIGSDHHALNIGADEIRAEISSGAWVFDDLFADWGTISTQLLYRRCREMGLKVVLVGEGADELFGGYDIFTGLPERLGLRAQFRLYQNYAGRRFGKLFGSFHEQMNTYLDSVHGNPMDAVRLFESRNQLPANYVMKVDKASMAESVEARAPYLDRRVADLAYATSIPATRSADQKKQLLREVARRDNLLPASIIDRHKYGGPLPSDWMDNDPSFRRFAADHILALGSVTERIGLRPAMQAYFERGRQGAMWPFPISIYRNLAWRLLLLELWAPYYLYSPVSA